MSWSVAYRYEEERECLVLYTLEAWIGFGKVKIATTRTESGESSSAGRLLRFVGYTTKLKAEVDG
jgi:hypothetical protein